MSAFHSGQDFAHDYVICEYFALDQCHFHESPMSCKNYFDVVASTTSVRAEKLNNACERSVLDLIMKPCYREGRK